MFFSIHTRRTPARHRRGPHVVEFLPRCNSCSKSRHFMKTYITFRLGLKGYNASGWPWCRIDCWRRCWGTYSTHKCGLGLTLFVSLLIHTDNHYSTQKSSLALVLPGQVILNFPARRRFWGWWRIRWTYFHLVLAGRGLFVSFRLYISTVEYLIKENSFISVTKGELISTLFAYCKISILPVYSFC